MVQQLHPDEHTKPGGRWVLKELVSERVYIELAEVQGQVCPEPWRKKRHGVNHWSILSTVMQKRMHEDSTYGKLPVRESRKR